MKALVTGANGFIGKHLCKKLWETGWELRQELHGVDVIFHLAGTVNGDVWGINVGGMAQILKMAEENGIERVVFPTSASAINPVNDYGKSKQLCEELGFWYQKQHGLETRILRFYNVYGPGQKHGWVADFERAIRNNTQPILYDKGEQVRDFIHVDDVVRLLVEGCGFEGGHVADVGTGVGTKIIDLWDMCAEVSGSTLTPLFVPSDKALSKIDVAKGMNYNFIPLRDGLKTVLPIGELCESC